MRNTGMTGLFAAVIGMFCCCCGTGVVFAAESADPVAAASEAPFHTILKGYTVRRIHTAAKEVIFNQLSLAKKKSDDCNCTSSKADLFTGRIEATSADGITFVFRIHYLDEAACGIWIGATQDSDVPGDLKMYCQMISDRTIARLKEMDKQQDRSDNPEGGLLEFSAEYNLSVKAMYKVINETANQAGIGHSTRTRNPFMLEGNFTSGHTRFSYKAYLVADDKLKFRFWSDTRTPTDGQRYIYETIYKEFQRQLKLQQSK